MRISFREYDGIYIFNIGGGGTWVFDKYSGEVREM